MHQFKDFNRFVRPRLSVANRLQDRRSTG
jgi:hypothetical protein